jgi:Bacterial aa3 type cytochrome c oxidase subunit IV
MNELGGDMSIDTSDGHEAMDYREHLRTYDGFLKGTVILVVHVAIILLGMLIFLV